mmetsp:Transcript_92733/g.235859  ORF Transcript_92733/g.235859 Transcript_92733/m.235859 type:complete len:322 (+) Transcript_92733:455-1420(+)
MHGAAEPPMLRDGLYFGLGTSTASGEHIDLIIFNHCFFLGACERSPELVDAGRAQACWRHFAAEWVAVGLVLPDIVRILARVLRICWGSTGLTLRALLGNFERVHLLFRGHLRLSIPSLVREPTSLVREPTPVEPQPHQTHRQAHHHCPCICEQIRRVLLRNIGKPGQQNPQICVGNSQLNHQDDQRYHQRDDSLRQLVHLPTHVEFLKHQHHALHNLSQIIRGMRDRVQCQGHFVVDCVVQPLERRERILNPVVDFAVEVLQTLPLLIHRIELVVDALDRFGAILQRLANAIHLPIVHGMDDPHGCDRKCPGAKTGGRRP